MIYTHLARATGLSKQMVKQRHGEKQFKAWRRGFNVRCVMLPTGSTSVSISRNFLHNAVSDHLLFLRFRLITLGTIPDM